MSIELAILPKDTLVYRSYSDSTKRDGYWFALKAEDTFGYGDKTAVYRLKKDLKLIDITKKSFYENLKQLIAKETQISPDFKQKQSIILFPLGFEDGVFYRDLAKQYGVDYNAYALNPMIHTESQLDFNNRSRLSIMQFDIEFVKFLKRQLGNVSDGIISLKPFPDIIRNGYQCSEMSVFDMSFVEYVNDTPRVVISGSSKTEQLAPIFIKTEGNENVQHITKNFDKIYNKFNNNYRHDVITRDLDGNIVFPENKSEQLAPIFIQMEGNEKTKEMTKDFDKIYKKMDEMGAKSDITNKFDFIFYDLNGNVIKRSNHRKTRKNNRK